MEDEQRAPRDQRVRTSGSPHIRGFGVAVAAAVVLSFTGVLMRVLTEDFGMPALVLAFWRNLFTTGLLLLALSLVRPALLRTRRANIGFLAAFAGTLAIFNALWTISVDRAGASLATILVYSSGAFTVVLGRLLLRESISPGKALSVILCFGGCGLVAWTPSASVLVGGSTTASVSATGPDAVGAATGVASGLCYAAYSLMGRAASRRGIDPWTSLFYTFAGATLLLGLANLIPDTSLPGTANGSHGLWCLGDRVDGWLVLAVLAAGPTLLGFGLYNISLSLLSSGTANLVLSAEPLATALLAWLLLGEHLTPTQAWGGLAIVVAVAILGLESTRSPRGTGAAIRADCRARSTA